MTNNGDGTYTYLVIPERFYCTYTKLLKKLSDLGVSIIDDCSSTCKGKSKQIINAWYIFQSACAAYTIGELRKADFLINYINKSFDFDCDIMGEIIVGHYTGSPQAFANMSLSDILAKSETNTVYLNDKTGSFTINQSSDVHFILVPKKITINKATFGTTLITTLYDNNTKSGAYRVNDYLSDDYTIYWFYSPIGAFNENIEINYSIENE